MGTTRCIVWLAISLASLEGWCAPTLARQEPAAAAQGATRRVAVTVVDDLTQQPLPDSSLRVMWSSHDQRVESNGTGAFTVEFPAHEFLVIVAEAPGRASLRAGYHTARGRAAPAPAEAVYALPKATTIGGRVVNERGEPVAGATIEVSGQARWDKQANTSLQFRREGVVTDAEGRWTFDQAPPDIFTLTLDIQHPDYIAALEHHSNQPQGDRPASALLPLLHEMTGVSTLADGVETRGVVLDPDGQPVPNAIISVPYQQYGPVQERTRSNERGEFSLRTDPGAQVLTIEAPDLAPLIMPIEATADAKPIEARVARGWVLRGRVVDPSGQPRENVRISVETIDGDRRRRYPVQWNARTDAQGRFEWRNAPDQPVTLAIYKSNAEMRLDGTAVTRSDEEIVFTMHPALSFRGKVTDASTGRPIEKFTLVYAVDFGGGPQQPLRQLRSEAETYESPTGEYFYTVVFPRTAHGLIFEADGYRAFQSGTYKNEDGAQTLDVALEPAASMTGTVVLADGTPVRGATVYIASAASPLFLYDGQPRDPEHENLTRATTDDQGRFSVPAQTGPFSIAVANDLGVVISPDAEFAQGQPLVLKPWARIEGVASRDSADLKDRWVGLDMYEDRVAPSFVYFRDTANPTRRAASCSSGRRRGSGESANRGRSARGCRAARASCRSSPNPGSRSK